jgi:two-component sensor histidine kinase
MRLDGFERMMHPKPQYGFAAFQSSGEEVSEERTMPLSSCSQGTFQPESNANLFGVLDAGGALEANHRIANSLQLVSAMLSSQRRELADPVAREAHDRSVQRVAAIASVHRQLYLSQERGGVDVAGYLVDLVSGLRRSFSAGMQDRRIDLEVGYALVPASFAAIIGVVVTELVINACKHAYRSNQAGGIQVMMTTGPERFFSLLVRDQGNGMQSEASSNGLGDRLLELMIRKLDARGGYSSEGSGTTYTMTGLIPA